MQTGNTEAKNARYRLVERDGLLWPAVICEQDMVPAGKRRIYPPGYYRAVLILGVYEM